MACKYFYKCKSEFKNINCINEEYCPFYKFYENKMKEPNPYWDNICTIADKQRKKGIETYGQGLEDNTWDIMKRIQYLEEELVDALMYLEWCKDYLSKQSSLEKSNVKECIENGT